MHFPKIHAAFMTEISCFEVTVRLFERCPLLSKDISKGIVFVLQRILCFKAAIQIYGNIYICINICVYICIYMNVFSGPTGVAYMKPGRPEFQSQVLAHSLL